MAVIKASELMARRARAPELRIVAALPAEPVVDPVRRALELQVNALTEELAQLSLDKAEVETALMLSRDQVAQAADDLAEAVVEAEAKGRAAGFEAGAEAKSESLARLEAAAEQAIEQLRRDLKGMETLAIALAKAGLAKVFGEDRDMANRVARLVRRQLQSVERAAVLRIEVSALDFPAPAALDELSRHAGLEGIEVKALESLDGGDCRLRLRLGELDIGVGQQWARLGALLDEALTAEAQP